MEEFLRYVPLILVLALGGGIYLYGRRRPAPTSFMSSEPSGIAGWLIVPAILVVLLPFVNAVLALQYFEYLGSAPDSLVAWSVVAAIANIALALAGDADRVVMVGFDCQHTGGQAHWHGNHPRGLTNAAQIPKWPALFKRLREAHPNAIIYNASRVTALDVFPRIPLEDALL